MKIVPKMVKFLKYCVLYCLVVAFCCMLAEGQTTSDEESIEEIDVLVLGAGLSGLGENYLTKSLPSSLCSLLFFLFS